MKWMLYPILLLTLTSVAQSGDYTSISIDADQFYGVDDFNHLYYARQDVLFKQQDTDLYQFYDVQLGNITSVDIINPLKIVVFYKDTQTVVLLDNRLNEQLRIDFAAIPVLGYIEFVKLAGERRLWLYNIDNASLQLYNYTKNQIINSSAPIDDQVIDMLADYNFCHLITSHGVTTYNTYASITDQLDITISKPACYNYNQIIFKNKDGWQWYRFTSKHQWQITQTTTPTTITQDPESLYHNQGNLYIYHHNTLHTISLNQPE